MGVGGRHLQPKEQARNLYISMIGILNVLEAENLLLIVWDEERKCKLHSFNQGPLFPSVYLARHLCHSCDKMVLFIFT